MGRAGADGGVGRLVAGRGSRIAGIRGDLAQLTAALIGVPATYLGATSQTGPRPLPAGRSGCGGSMQSAEHELRLLMSVGTHPQGTHSWAGRPPSASFRILSLTPSKLSDDPLPAASWACWSLPHRGAASAVCASGSANVRSLRLILPPLSPGAGEPGTLAFWFFFFEESGCT